MINILVHTMKMNRFMNFNCKLTFNVAFFWIALPCALADTLPVPDVGSTAYVLASSAKLRAQASNGAPVQTKLFINTKVKINGKSGDWCEVSVIDGAQTDKTASQELHHGFMACNLLSTKVISLSDVYAQLAKASDAKDALNLISRAFWIAPSLSRWATVGYAYAGAFPDTYQQRDSYDPRPLPRIPMPEFEAMKAHLSTGMLVKQDDYWPNQGWDVANSKQWNEYFAPHVRNAMTRISFPHIQQSLFTSHNIPVVIPGEQYYGFNNTGLMLALVDELSASNNVSFKVNITDREHYGMDDSHDQFASDTSWRMIKVSGPMDINMGIWDAGGLHIVFDRDVVLHGVTDQGRQAALNISEAKLSIGYDSACSYEHSNVELRSSPVAGYAAITSAIVKWAGDPMPGGKTAKAQIKSHKFPGNDELELVVTKEIDLNNDGNADFLIWQGRYQAQVSAEGLWEAVFANINGRWRLLSYNEDADCT